MVAITICMQYTIYTKNSLKFLSDHWHNVSLIFWHTSRTGLDCKSLDLMPSTLSFEVLQILKYCKMYFEASVFPDPDSPDIKMHWFLFSFRILRYALSAMANLSKIVSRLLYIMVQWSVLTHEVAFHKN